MEEDSAIQPSRKRSPRILSHLNLYLCLSVFLCGSISFFCAAPASAQDWFKTGTGLGVSKGAGRRGGFCVQGHAFPASGRTLQRRACGRTWITAASSNLVSKSYNPLQTPGTPAEVDYKAWSGAPASAQLLAFGNFSVNGNNVEIQAWLNDVRDASLPPVIGKVYRGEATEAQVRTFAHQFADEIIGKLSGGLPGIAARRSPL